MTIEKAKAVLGIETISSIEEVNKRYKKALKMYHPDNKLSKKYTVSEAKEARDLIVSIAKQMESIGNFNNTSTDIVDIEDVSELKYGNIDKIVSMYGKEMSNSELNSTEPMIRIHGSVECLSGITEFEVYRRYTYLNKYEIGITVDVEEVHQTESEMTLNFCDKKIRINIPLNDAVVKTTIGGKVSFTIQIHRRVKRNEP